MSISAVFEIVEPETGALPESTPNAGAPNSIGQMLDARRFDLVNPPTKPVPVLLIGDNAIATSGNLVAVTAQAKAGKTALLTAMLAALMEPSGDCLGIAGDNSGGLAVLHFDTEQSPYDHHGIILQVLRRAGCDRPPQWLRSYHLADVSTKERRSALAHEMNRTAVGGKLRGVFLDGTADLCVDPNDPVEAFGLVEELHRLAITFDCPIICALHENPGQNDNGKTRGHLGSQLERKAETNLRLSKVAQGVTTVFTERSRHCHIPKERGSRFVWDDTAGMHVSVKSNGSARLSEKAEQLKRLVVDVFTSSAKPSLRHKDLVAAIVTHQSCSERTAKTRIDEAVSARFMQHHPAMGLYSQGAL